MKNKKLVFKNLNIKQASLLVLLSITAVSAGSEIASEKDTQRPETIITNDHSSLRPVGHAPVISVDRHGQRIGVFAPSHWRGITVSADTASDLIMDCRSSGGGHFRVTLDPPLLLRRRPP